MKKIYTLILLLMIVLGKLVIVELGKILLKKEPEKEEYLMQKLKSN